MHVNRPLAWTQPVKEVHAAQYKKCGACKAAVYCCREHQVVDWPAHKKACKAARTEGAA